MEISQGGVFYEHAVAPARWSLPSHASIFSGKLPSEHEIFYDGQNLSAPLVDELNSEGYTTSGFSANPYASERCSFDQPFDIFEEPTRYEESGFKPAEYDSVHNGLWHYSDVVKQALLNDHPIASIKNVAVDSCLKLGLINGDQRTHNTFQRATKFLRQYSSNSPFFTFINLMSTHSPYQPSAQRQWRVSNRIHKQDYIEHLNNSFVRPPEFLEKYYSTTHEINETHLQNIKDLYKSEVKNASIYASRLYKTVKEVQNDRDTLVVITADHGQALGEPEYNGERRMGHVETVSDNVLKVPLLILHPDINDIPDGTAELRSIFNLCRNAAVEKNEEVTSVIERSDICISECPATGNEDYLNRNNIPDRVNDLQAKIHTVVGYYDNMKYMERSNGEQVFWKASSEESIEAAPSILIEAVQDRLTDLKKANKGHRPADPEDETKKRLKDLGYI